MIIGQEVGETVKRVERKSVRSPGGGEIWDDAPKGNYETRGDGGRKKLKEKREVKTGEPQRINDSHL